MYYVLSGLLAMLVSLKYTKHVTDKHQEEYLALVSKIELLEERNSKIDKELLQLESERTEAAERQAAAAAVGLGVVAAAGAVLAAVVLFAEVAVEIAIAIACCT